MLKNRWQSADGNKWTGRADPEVTDRPVAAAGRAAALPGAVRSARLRRAILRRLRVLWTVAVSACVLACALACGFFFPTQPGPPLPAAAEIRTKDLLFAVEAEALAAADAGREITLTLSEDCLAVLLSRLVESAGGRAQVWVQCRPEIVRVWMRLDTAVRIPAVIELRVQPSLLDGLLFCGLRGARIGLWPFPLAWRRTVRAAGAGGWTRARDAFGYAFPGSFALQGQRFEFVDLWPGDGWVEVSLRPVPQGGD